MDTNDTREMVDTIEELDRRELLEQYALGLTSRGQADRVRSLLEKDPAARRQLAYLRDQLSAYADTYSPVNKPADRNPRSPEDFDDLDHEMIMAMTERNHSLIIWRYALGFACLLLLGLSGYLFRQYQITQAQLVTEQALHAQDDVSHQLQLESLEENAVDWTALRTETYRTGIGNVLVHHPDGKETILLDFSHLAVPEGDAAYHLFVWEDAEEQPADLLLTAQQLNRLYPLDLPVARLELYHAPGGTPLTPPLAEADLVAEISLSAAE